MLPRPFYSTVKSAVRRLTVRFRAAHNNKMRGLRRFFPLNLPPLLVLKFAAFAFVSRAAAQPPQHSDHAPAKPASTERSQMLWDQGFQLPPGSHLRFAEVQATGGPGAHTLRYRVYADAAQMGTPYVLAVWRIGTAIDDLEVLSESAYVNRRGLVLANLPNPGQVESDALNDGSELDVTFRASEGEPVRFILRSQDWKTMIGGTIVPYPIAATNKTCKLSALKSDPDGHSLLIYLDGFPANADVALDDGTHPRTVHTDAHGQAGSVETPGSGSGSLTESAKSSACTVSLAVPYGKGSGKQQ